jgi:hypothetical protein
MKKGYALPLLLVLLQLSLFGQTGSINKTIGTERGKLQFLVGTFITESSMPAKPSLPKGGTGKGTLVITWALDSTFLFIEDQSVNSVFGQYKGHGVLGFDSHTQQFVLSMFNNFGDRPSYNGNFVGDTLILETKVPMPGGSFDQKLLWYKGNEEVKLRILNNSGKGFLLAIEQTATPDLHKMK